MSAKQIENYYSNRKKWSDNLSNNDKKEILSSKEKKYKNQFNKNSDEL